jgi:hypothetical protein
MQLMQLKKYQYVISLKYYKLYPVEESLKMLSTMREPGLLWQEAVD